MSVCMVLPVIHTVAPTGFLSWARRGYVGETKRDCWGLLRSLLGSSICLLAPARGYEDLPGRSISSKVLAPVTGPSGLD